MKNLSVLVLLVAATGCGMIKDKLGDKKGADKPVETQAAKTGPGAPLAPVPVPQLLGTETLNAQVCKIQGAEFTGTSTSSLIKAISASNGNVVLVDSTGALRGFKVAPGPDCVLSVDPTFGVNGTLKLEKEINWLSEDTTGRIVASSGIFDAYVVKNGQLAYNCQASGHIELNATGTWGIAPWVNATVKKVDVTDTACASSDWALQNLSDDTKRKGPFSMIGAAVVSGETIYVGGQLAKSIDPEQAWTVASFNLLGVEQSRLAVLPDISSPQHFGWIHSVQPCKQGICVVDSNFRRLSAWSPTGAFIGSVELSKLFNLDYPWISDFDIDVDGSAYFVTAQTRKDSETSEGLIYRVRGLGTGELAVAAPPVVLPKGTGGDNDVKVVSAKQTRTEENATKGSGKGGKNKNEKEGKGGKGGKKGKKHK